MPAIDSTSSIDEFLNAAAAKRPAPGGGAVAALAGALAAAMGEMVVNYSVGKRDLVAFTDELNAALRQFHAARGLLRQLMVEDQLAFEALQAAKKRPETDADRRAALDAAVLACIRVPQAIGATATALLELAASIVDKSNRWLLSDLLVCCELATATVRCATYNVRINLPEVQDDAERARFEEAADDQLQRAVRLVQATVPAIEAAMAEG
jgi:formiminotetrahydrofolate cyclodeaminase